MSNLPDPFNLVMTSGVRALQGKGFPDTKDDYLFQPKLMEAVREQYVKEPDEDTKGGNDKRFFVAYFREVKLFVAENEVGGLTIMLPEEY